MPAKMLRENGRELAAIQTNLARESNRRVFLSQVVFSADGKRLASLCGTAVQLWDAEKGQELAKLMTRR